MRSNAASIIIHYTSCWLLCLIRGAREGDFPLGTENFGVRLIFKTKTLDLPTDKEWLVHI